MDVAIRAQGLAKTYTAAGRAASGASASGESAGDRSPNVEAVRGVDLRIEQGEIYALLGPNGAGKSTTISMLTTLLLPTRGWARVAGFDTVQQASEVRRRIGVTFQEIVLDQDLSGRQVLDFHGGLYGMPRGRRRDRVRELAALVELEQAMDRKVARYSGGMKRRLELARGLMTEPEVLFLDEPTQGLDPQNRASIWRYIRDLRERTGMTLLLTTHSMEEAESLADRVGILDGGLLMVEGAPATLVREMGADVIDVVGAGDIAGLEQRLLSLPFVQHTGRHTLEGGLVRLQVGVDQGDRRLPAIVHAASDANFPIHEISVVRPSLGEVFLARTGRHLRDKAEP